MRNKKKKILVSVLISLLVIGLAIIFINSLSAKRSLILVEKELEKEIEKLKAAGIPTTIEELNLPKIPEEKNGAFVYRAIFEFKDSLNETYKELIDYFPHQGRLTMWEKVPEEKKKEVIELILHNPKFADLYILLEKASNMECRFSTNEDYKKKYGYNYDLKVGQYLRSCARDSAEKAKIEREYGDINKSLKASIIGLKLSKSLANEPAVIYQLVRFALDGIALGELEETLNKGEGNLELYQSLIDEIEKERKVNIINFALKGEFVCCNLTLFSQYRKLGEKAFELTEEQKKIEVSHGADIFKQIKDKKQAFKNIYLKSGCKTPEEFFGKEEIFSFKIQSKVIPLTEKPYWQVSKKLEKIDADIENLQDKSLLSNIISSSNQRLYMSEALYDAQLGAAEIVIANKIYKAKHGEYVDSPSQLSPEILPSIPLDPFTGKDYIYKKKDKGFIIYSVGQNLKDDNGTKRIYRKNSPAYENYDIAWECSF